MALIYCPECGEQISNKATSCPHCGCPLQKENKTATFNLQRESKAIYCAAKYNVFLDDLFLGLLRNGESLSSTVDCGKHHLRIVDKTNFNMTVYDNDINIGEGGLTLLFAAGPKINLHQAIDSTNFGFENSARANKNDLNKANKNTALGIISGIIILFTIIIVYNILFPRSINQSNNSTNKTSVTASKQNNIENTSPSPTPIPTFNSVMGTVGTWEISVNDFYYSKSVSAGLITEYRAEEGSQYCIVEISVKNIGKQSATFLPFVSLSGDPVAKVVWGQYEYSRTNFLGLKNNTIFSETLNPLVSTNGILAFEVPNDVVESDTAPVFIISVGQQVFQCELVKG